MSLNARLNAWYFKKKAPSVKQYNSIRFIVSMKIQ